MKSSPNCRCGAALESLKHFVLDCPLCLSQNYTDRESQHGYNLLYYRYQIFDMWQCKFAITIHVYDTNNESMMNIHKQKEKQN
jgi:hypothetical protein